MGKIDEVKAKLTELGIEFDADAKLADLKKLLPSDEEDAVDEDESEEVEGEDVGGGITVRDPLILRPRQLPLVVILPKDASKAQKEYARTLNAYAYKNPEKWAQKKNDKTVDGTVVKGLLTKLKELKDAPDPVEIPGGVSYKNHLIEGQA